MRATADICSFPPRPSAAGGAWSNQDLAEIYRCIDRFAQHGLVLEAASGLSEEGDPWFALEDVHSGEAMIHIARIDGFYVVAVMDGDAWETADLRAALDELLASGPLESIADVESAGVPSAGDPLGSFLRVVSTLMACLTADLILEAVQGEVRAAEPPLPSNPAASTLAAAGLEMLLPDISLEQSAPEILAAEPIADRAGAGLTLGTLLEDGPRDALALDHRQPFADGTLLRELPERDTAPVRAAPVLDVPPSASEPPPSAAGERLHLLVVGEAVELVGSPDADLFRLELAPDARDLIISLHDFQLGEDAIVVEQAHEDGTSSAIILDPSLLPAGPMLTVIGQMSAAEASHPGGVAP